MIIKAKTQNGMKKISFLFFPILLIWSCNAKQEIQLEKFKTITQTFNAKQVKGLNEILAFFDEEVCKSAGIEGKEVLDCYQKYFEKLALSVETGNLEINISYPKQTEFLSKINPDLFQEIWNERQMIKFKDRMHKKIPPDTLQIIFLKLDGGYADFLKIFAKKNDKIKFYSNHLQAVSDISPSIVADVLMNYKDYDISDEHIRLVIAIHYLTLNYQYSKWAVLDNRIEGVEKIKNHKTE